MHARQRPRAFRQAAVAQSLSVDAERTYSEAAVLLFERRVDAVCSFVDGSELVTLQDARERRRRLL